MQELYDTIHLDRTNIEEEIKDDSDGDLRDIEKAQREQEDVSVNVMRWYRDCEPQACIRYSLGECHSGTQTTADLI